VAHLSRSKGVIRRKRKVPASGDQGYDHLSLQVALFFTLLACTNEGATDGQRALSPG
jgi:hypothetical protein